jgi:hypothetical protein
MFYLFNILNYNYTKISKNLDILFLKKKVERKLNNTLNHKRSTSVPVKSNSLI